MTRTSQQTSSKGIFKGTWRWFTCKIKKAYNYLLGKKDNVFPVATKNIQKQKMSSYRKYVHQKLKSQSQKKTKSEINNRFRQYLENRVIMDKQEDFSCPICLQTVIYPCATPCGHSFCFKCLEQSIIFNTNCPVCRMQIRGMEIVPCHFLQTLISKKSVNLLCQAMLQTYKQRQKDMKKWKQDRTVDWVNLQIGETLDVRDTEYIWCRGEIKDIYFTNGQPSSILIHYKGWNKIYDEILDVKSSRLAPLTFFSARKDIPRYNLQEEDENMRGAVVTGQQQRPPERQPQPQERPANGQLSFDFLDINIQNQERHPILRISRQRPQGYEYRMNNLIQLFQNFRQHNLAIEIEQDEVVESSLQEQPQQQYPILSELAPFDESMSHLSNVPQQQRYNVISLGPQSQQQEQEEQEEAEEDAQEQESEQQGCQEVPNMSLQEQSQSFEG